MRRSLDYFVTSHGRHTIGWDTHPIDTSSLGTGTDRTAGQLRGDDDV